MAKYAPGSFTKNFAWNQHGPGLMRLHSTIRGGYHSALTTVEREAWRADSGINDASLDLIPINFFLHNRLGRMSIDELVFQAIKRPHSLRFDRLALFALLLSRVGTPPGKAEARPSMWANEFVRQALWKAGEWRSSALLDTNLDRFIEDHVTAMDDSLVKCRNNLRGLFEYCGYWPTPLPTINSGAEEWAASALFLAWDRYLLGGGKATEADLLNTVSADELHKLMGVKETWLAPVAAGLVTEYLGAGALRRFQAPAAAAPPAAPRARPASPAAAPAPAKPEVLPADLLDEEGSDAAVSRTIKQAQVQERNRRLSAKLRLGYAHKCQFCRKTLQVGEERFYSEAAHIKAIGEPHNGPDKLSNMIVLCPNHHIQFDHGILRIVQAGTGYSISSKIAGDPLHGKPLLLKHRIDDACVKWHFNWWQKAGR